LASSSSGTGQTSEPPVWLCDPQPDYPATSPNATHLDSRRTPDEFADKDDGYGYINEGI